MSKRVVVESRCSPGMSIGEHLSVFLYTRSRRAVKSRCFVQLGNPQETQKNRLLQELTVIAVCAAAEGLASMCRRFLRQPTAVYVCIAVVSVVSVSV